MGLKQSTLRNFQIAYGNRSRKSINIFEILQQQNLDKYKNRHTCSAISNPVYCKKMLLF